MSSSRSGSSRNSSRLEFSEDSLLSSASPIEIKTRPPSQRRRGSVDAQAVNSLGKTSSSKSASSTSINCHISFGCEVTSDGSRQITFHVPDTSATDRDTEDCGPQTVARSTPPPTVAPELPPAAPCHALCGGGMSYKSLESVRGSAKCSAKSVLALPSTRAKSISATSHPLHPTLPPAPLDGRHRHTSEPLSRAVCQGARAADHLPSGTTTCSAARAAALPSKLLHSRAAGRSHFGARLKARAATAREPAEASDAIAIDPPSAPPDSVQFL